MACCQNPPSNGITICPAHLHAVDPDRLDYTCFLMQTAGKVLYSIYFTAQQSNEHGRITETNPQDN